MPIHESAIVGKKARLGAHVDIGPYTIIQDGVSIGDRTTIQDHAYIGKGTAIGEDNLICTGAVIGHEAQHKASSGIESALSIGGRNVFREYVTGGLNEALLSRLKLPRLALHASRLSFRHPVTRELVEFSSQAPAFMREMHP